MTTPPPTTRRQRDLDRLHRAVGFAVVALVWNADAAVCRVRSAPRRLVDRLGAWMSPDLVVCRWANCTHVEDES